MSAYHHRTDHTEQINSHRTIDLFQRDQRISLMGEKCTYKRNESPHPMEVDDLKISGTTVSLFKYLRKLSFQIWRFNRGLLHVVNKRF